MQFQRWQQDLRHDIRTFTEYDDWDAPPYTMLHHELSDCNRQSVRDRFLAQRDRCTSILEIGVGNNGDRSLYWLFRELKLPNCTYVGIDLRDLAELNQPDQGLHIIQANSSAVEENLARCSELGINHWDFVFIDGWHSINQMLTDWEYTRWLRAGGLVGVHDTAVHPGPSRFMLSLREDLWRVDANVCRGQDWGLGWAESLRAR